MNKFEIKFDLDGKNANPPKNWEDITVRCIIDDYVQPLLITDEFVFVNENAQTILEWISIYGPFVGIPFSIVIHAHSIGRIEYTGCLDLANDFKVISETEVSCKFKPDEGIDLLDERIQAITFGYLASLDRGEPGFIDREHFVDVPVVIRKKFDGVEVAITTLALFQIQSQIRQFLKEKGIKTLKDFKTFILPPTSTPAEIFEAIGIGILLLAYTVFMLIVIIQFFRIVLKNLLPQTVKYKGITLRTALERSLDYFEITLDCNIPELDYYVYLPSKTDNKIRKNRKDEGIPNTADYGYQVVEMFELVNKLFNARGYRYSVNGKDVFFIRSRKDPETRTMSSYVLPDILSESYEVNSEDLKANFIISFQYDPTDEYTMPNARDTPFDSKKVDEEKNRYEKGVSYEVLTDVTHISNPKHKLNRGLEEVRIPLALGTRRGNLSVLEHTAKILLTSVDVIIKLFGGKTLGEKIEEGRGRLLISHNSFSTAKLIVLQNGIIPQNHRDLLSARILYQKYHSWRSFVTNPNYAQRKNFKGIRIPFDFTDFVKTQRFSEFTTASGREGIFKSINWTLSKDYAIADFQIYEQYTNNLHETFIEP